MAMLVHSGSPAPECVKLQGHLWAPRELRWDDSKRVYLQVMGCGRSWCSARREMEVAETGAVLHDSHPTPDSEMERAEELEGLIRVWLSLRVADETLQRAMGEAQIKSLAEYLAEED